MIKWLDYAVISKVHSTKWSVSFKFTDCIWPETTKGALDIFVGYTRTKTAANKLAKQWLINQANLILEQLDGKTDIR